MSTIALIAAALVVIGTVLIIIPCCIPDPKPHMGNYSERRPGSLILMSAGIVVLVASGFFTILNGILALKGM